MEQCFDSSAHEFSARGAIPSRHRKQWQTAILAAALVGSCLGVAPSARAADPLLDLLLNKGMISEAEAAAVKAEADALRTNNLAADPTTMSAPKSRWTMKSGHPGMELFGDLRLRVEDRKVTGAMGGDIELQRLRYSARVGLRGEVMDDFYFGVRLDPSANARSAWLTLGANSSSGTYQGPFGKSTASLNLGQLYLGWHGADWFDITAGKMANPLYTTSLVWDSDIAPEGFTEHFQYTVGEADLFATFGQFLYQDPNPTKASKGFFNLGYNSANLPFLLAWQGGVKYHLTKSLTLKIAPVLYTYSSHGVNLSGSGSSDFPGFAGTFVGQGSTNGINGAAADYSGYPSGPYDGFAANQTGVNDLTVLEIPVELNFKLDKINLQLFGDYAQNLDGGKRARAAFIAQQSALLSSSGLSPIPAPQTHDVHAYLVGVAIGNGEGRGPVSKKHEWELRTSWQHVEQYALDPNLLDSDFFEGRANLEGMCAALNYGLTDNLVGTLRYGYARRINEKLGTGGSNLDLPQMNPIKNFSLLMLDLSLKF